MIYFQQVQQYNDVIRSLHLNISYSRKMQKSFITPLKTLTQRVMFNNIFAKVPMAPPDPIIGVNVAFNADTDPKKVNLGVGAYRDDNAKPYIFKVVRKVQQEILNDQTLNKEYIPIDGLPGFNAASQKLIFGEDCQARKQGRVVTVQALSGTGSLRVGFQFLNQQIPSTVLVSNPTWANHHNIIRRSGLKFEEYPYFNQKTKSFKAKQCLQYLNNAKQGNIVLLHACAHNPTGVDPTFQDWQKIAQIMKKKKLVPYFDSAYQGFASGDIIKDAQAIRYFVKEGFSLLVSQSYAKNMGLYGERVGALHVVSDNKQTADKVLSQLKQVIRANYSSPPIHGARIAERVLSKSENLEQWKTQLKEVANRIISMRSALRGRLEQIKTPGTWNHITDQIGMFSYTGLNEKQVTQFLIKKHHIHLVKNGRISMAGVNTKNVNYIADAIKDAVTNSK